MDSEQQVAFKTEFARLVSAHGLARCFGLTRVRRRPGLRADEVYLETEKADRSLAIEVVPRAIYPGTINAAWYLQADEAAGWRLVDVQPCAHQALYDDYDPAASNPRTHPEFVDAFVRLARRHGAADDFGLALVHRHFGMTDDEALLESACDDGSIAVRIAPRRSIGEAEALTWHVEGDARCAWLHPVHFGARFDA